MSSASTTKLHHKLVAVTAERDALAAELQKLREQLFGPDGWEANARYVLDRCKHTVRLCEDGGPENLCGSLILTFTKMEDTLAGKSPVPAVAAPAVPKLQVWFGSLPETNGKTNWTAILHRDNFYEGITIDRSEYKDRVRYEADRMRWMIGVLEEEPDILQYDASLHSGYKVPAVPTDEQIHAAYRVALGQSIRERDMPEIRKFAIALLQSAEVTK